MLTILVDFAGKNWHLKTKNILCAHNHFFGPTLKIVFFLESRWRGGPPIFKPENILKKADFAKHGKELLRRFNVLFFPKGSLWSAPGGSPSGETSVP